MKQAKATGKTWKVVPALASEPLSGRSSAGCADVAEDGRDAQPDLFATYEQAEAVVDSAWSPDIAFYVRQVPALRPRVALRASSSYAMGDGVGLRREWIPEPNTYNRAGLRAVVGEFLLENDPTVLTLTQGSPRWRAT